MSRHLSPPCRAVQNFVDVSCVVAEDVVVVGDLDLFVNDTSLVGAKGVGGRPHAANSSPRASLQRYRYHAISAR
jgi:hypothetical protein